MYKNHEKASNFNKEIQYPIEIANLKHIT